MSCWSGIFADNRNAYPLIIREINHDGSIERYSSNRNSPSICTANHLADFSSKL